ncbi:MAG: rhodanese-like domain-containing protein [Telluria sp.]|nr:rhodanese-like domain-containing protein [Telluria sp.]
MKSFKHAFLLLAAAGAFCSSGLALAKETPTSLKGAEVVDAAKAKALIDAGVKVIDMRPGNEYAEAHIRGAINVPYKEKSAKEVDFDAALDSIDLSKLPADKSAPIITLCNGVECWRSFKGATAAIKAGYKKVYWFRGGVPEWKAKGLPVD